MMRIGRAVRTAFLIFLVGLPAGGCSSSADPGQCGVAMGDGVARFCTPAGEQVCVCATHRCARPVETTACPSGYRYVYGDGECVVEGDDPIGSSSGADLCSAAADADADGDADGDADVPEAEDEGSTDTVGDGDADEGWEADVSCRPNMCPPEMIYIPCGPFVMGSDPGEGNPDEEPEHVVWLSAYCIDQSELTLVEYRLCDNPSCTDAFNSSDPDNYPAALNWDQARAYCEFRSKHLPTEAQWEKAARGGCEIVLPATCGPEDERRYPWGEDTPTCE